jgi:hypothetical protein
MWGEPWITIARQSVVGFMPYAQAVKELSYDR